MESLQTKIRLQKSLRDRNQVWRIISVEIIYLVSFFLRLGNFLTTYFPFLCHGENLSYNDVDDILRRQWQNNRTPKICQQHHKQNEHFS